MADYLISVVSILMVIRPIFYRHVSTNGAPLVPLTPSTRRLLDLLFVGALIPLILSTSYFTPENVYTLTGTDISTPTSKVFNLLSTYRNLTSTDEALRFALKSDNNRLLYAWLGPAPLLDCAWCQWQPTVYPYYYSLPRVLLPHLLHAVFISAVMSHYFGRFGPYWRVYAGFPMLALAGYEAWRLSDWGNNEIMLSTRRVLLADTDWHYWTMRTVRLVAFSTMDAFLGLAVWLSATRRWRLGWEGFGPREIIKEADGKLRIAAAHLHAGGLLKQAVMRDPELRQKVVDFWVREDAAGRDLMRDEEVAEARSKLDIDSLRQEVGQRSKNLVGYMRSLAQQEGHPQQQ